MSPYSLVLLFFATAHGFYKGTDVVELTAQNFAETVFGNEYVWLVEFYAPCTIHTDLKRVWALQKLEANLGKVGYTDEGHRQGCCC